MPGFTSEQGRQEPCPHVADSQLNKNRSVSQVETKGPWEVETREVAHIEGVTGFLGRIASVFIGRLRILKRFQQDWTVDQNHWLKLNRNKSKAFT